MHCRSGMKRSPVSINLWCVNLERFLLTEAMSIFSGRGQYENGVGKKKRQPRSYVHDAAHARRHSSHVPARGQNIAYAGPGARWLVSKRPLTPADPASHELVLLGQLPHSRVSQPTETITCFNQSLVCEFGAFPASEVSKFSTCTYSGNNYSS